MHLAMYQQGLELFRTQGPVFWGAVAAIAAGLTILLVSVFLFVKSNIQKHRNRKSKSSKVANPYQMKNFPGRPLGADAPQHSLKDLAPSPVGMADEGLLERLRQTAARLESLQEALNSQMGAHQHSPLKQAPPAVEYVFKKGVG